MFILFIISLLVIKAFPIIDTEYTIKPYIQNDNITYCSMICDCNAVSEYIDCSTSTSENFLQACFEIKNGCKDMILDCYPLPFHYTCQGKIIPTQNNSTQYCVLNFESCFDFASYIALGFVGFIITFLISHRIYDYFKITRINPDYNSYISLNNTR